jgi:PEP-CTERM motif
LGFELELSAGVGNASAVPEPQTWAVLAAGIAVLIAAKRRKASRASRACALVR